MRNTLLGQGAMRDHCFRYCKLSKISREEQTIYIGRQIKSDRVLKLNKMYGSPSSVSLRRKYEQGFRKSDMTEMPVNVANEKNFLHRRPEGLGEGSVLAWWHVPSRRYVRRRACATIIHLPILKNCCHVISHLRDRGTKLPGSRNGPK